MWIVIATESSRNSGLLSLAGMLRTSVRPDEAQILTHLGVNYLEVDLDVVMVAYKPCLGKGVVTQP